MVSATIPSDVETMVLKLTQNPVFISVGNPSTPTQSVKQLVIWVEEKAKKKHLFSILNDKRHYQPPVVVFVDSKVGAGMLAEAIHKVTKLEIRDSNFNSANTKLVFKLCLKISKKP